MTIKVTAAVLDMDAILDTADIFAMAAIVAMATALDTEAIIAMATILAIKYKLLKKYIQKREASTEVSLFCWDTRTRTRKNRTRICCVTITPYPNVNPHPLGSSCFYECKGTTFLPTAKTFPDFFYQNLNFYQKILNLLYNYICN